MKLLIILAVLVAAVSCLSIPSENELLGHWQKFKATHGKKYENAIDEAFRMKIFKENAIRVAKHNDRFDRGEVTFKVAVNKFSDLLQHEVSQRLNGFRASKAVKSGRAHNVSAISTSPFVGHNKVDWRTQGYVTPVKDQGDCSSCWSFSTTGAIEGQLFKKTGKLVSLSEQNLMDCNTQSRSCNGGYVATAFMYVRNNGIDTEESYPYEGADRQCRFNNENAVGANLDYYQVDVGYERALQKAVQSIGPISVAMNANHWSFHHYASGVFYEADCRSTIDDLDHAILAVGYGNAGRGKDYWLVKNSWGTEWGEEGYFKIARNKNNHCGIVTQALYPLFS